MLSAPRNLLKSNASAFDTLARIADPLLVVIVGWAAHWIYLGSPVVPPAYWVAILAVALCSLLVFPATGLYRPQRGASPVEDLRSLVYGWLALVAIGVLVAFVTKTSDTFSRAWAATPSPTPRSPCASSGDAT